MTNFRLRLVQWDDELYDIGDDGDYDDDTKNDDDDDDDYRYWRRGFPKLCLPENITRSTPTQLSSSKKLNE